METIKPFSHLTPLEALALRFGWQRHFGRFQTILQGILKTLDEKPKEQWTAGNTLDCLGCMDRLAGNFKSQGNFELAAHHWKRCLHLNDKWLPHLTLFPPTRKPTGGFLF